MISVPGLGLLVPGCPIVKRVGFDEGKAVEIKGIFLEYLEPDPAGERCLCYFFDSRIGRDVGFTPRIDLEEELGRVVVAKWTLAQLFGQPSKVRCTPRFDFFRHSTFMVDSHQNGGCLRFVQSRGVLPKDSVFKDLRTWRDYEFCYYKPALKVDPWDSTRLPDGSLRVEAEALRDAALQQMDQVA